MDIVANCEPVSKKKRMIIKCRGVVVGVVESLCDHSTALYFDNPTWRDVRGLMAVARGWVLRGCRLHFRADAGESEYPSGWCRAEEMGATCTTVMDSSVTHLVSEHAEDVIWAEQEVKFLVHPRWIDDAYFLWIKPPEVEYLP